MKHFFGLVVFFLSVPQLISQTLEFGLNTGPTISYRTYDDRGATAIEPLAIISGEKQMYTFDFGLDMRYRLHPRWKIGTGVWYSQKGFSNVNVRIAYQDLVLDEVAHIDFIQNYLDLPLTINYKLNQSDRFDIYGVAGLVASFLLSEKNNVILKNGEISSAGKESLEKPYLSNTTNINLGWILGIGIQKAIDEKYVIGFEPSFRRMESALVESQYNTERKLYSFTLNFRFVRII